MKKLKFFVCGAIASLLLSGCFGSSRESFSETQDEERPSHDDTPSIDPPITTEDPKIKISFYDSGSSNANELYSTTIEGTSFTWNSSLYKGDEIKLEQPGFKNVFQGWYSYTWINLLVEDQYVSMDDYVFPDGYEAERKDGVESAFRIHFERHSNTYHVLIYALWETFPDGYNVTFKNIDGEVLDKVNVPSHKSQHSSIYTYKGAQYLGKTPKYFTDEGPKKFVGWDTSTSVVTQDIEATAVYDDDLSVTRHTRTSSGSTNISLSSYLCLIHNYTNVSFEINLFRDGEFLNTVFMIAKSTLYFDVTDGIDGFTANITGSVESGPYLVYDTYNDYALRNYNDNGSFNGDTYKIDLTDKPNLSQVVVTNKSYANNQIKFFTCLDIELFYNTQLIILDGITKLYLRYVDPNDNSDTVRGHDIKKIQAPASLVEITSYFVSHNTSYSGEGYLNSNGGQVGSLFLYNGDNIFYFGNNSNPYLSAYRGIAPRVAKDCVNIIYCQIRDTSIDDSSISNNFVIPKSVRYINNLDCAGSKVTFEDSTGLEKVGVISNAEIDEIVSLSEYFEPLYENYYLFEDCKIKGLSLPSHLELVRNPTYNCDVGEYLITNNSVRNLYVESGELMIDKTLLAVPTAKLEGIYHVREGVEIISEGAIDEGTRYSSYSSEKGKLTAVILSSTIKELKYQQTNADFYSITGYFDSNYYYVYGCATDGSLITYQGVTYGLKDGNAIALSYDQKEVSQDLEIPDFVTGNGINYPVTEINRCALIHISVRSITFGHNLKNIGSHAMYRMHGLTSNIYIPDTVESIDDYAFVDIEAKANIEFSIGYETFKNSDSSALSRGYYSDSYEYLPTYVIRANSVIEGASLISQYGKVLTIKQNYDPESETLKYSYSVSHLCIEVNGVRTSFDKINEINVGDYWFDIEMLTKYFPNVKKINLKLRLYETYPDENEIDRKWYIDIGNLIEFLTTQKEELVNNLSNYGISDFNVYIDASEEDFIEAMKNIVYHKYLGNSSYEYTNIFEYEDGIFYIDESIVGNGVHYILTQGDYEIPLKGGVTYLMQIRYKEAN